MNLVICALTLSVGWQEGHPVCKKLALILQQNRLHWYGHVLRKDDDDGGVLAWLSAWSEVQTCIWPS